MQTERTVAPIPADDRIARIWRDEHRYLRAMAVRILHDDADADDAVQDAFRRLTSTGLDTIDDPRGWLIVITRRICLDRLRSARSQRESGAYDTVGPQSADDPADRITMDDEVQLALAVVLDRLTPAERTAFVLHDVFGFPFAGIAEIVGRTPAACRQLASRARKSVRSDTGAGTAIPSPGGAKQPDPHPRRVAQRFIAACAGGDIDELMALLDPDVVGLATRLGHGPIVELAGRTAVSRRLMVMFGPDSKTTLSPLEVNGRPGMVALARGRAIALISLDEADGTIHHIRSFVLPARAGRRPGG